MGPQEGSMSFPTDQYPSQPYEEVPDLVMEQPKPETKVVVVQKNRCCGKKKKQPKPVVQELDPLPLSGVDGEGIPPPEVQSAYRKQQLEAEPAHIHSLQSGISE